MITNNGLKILINRGYKSVPDYEPVTRFKIGVDQSDPTITSTDLVLPVPITGTITVTECDATTDWNESTDGDIDVTTTNFKQGVYALTLIKDAQTEDNVSWYNEDLTQRDFTDRDLWGWIYIKDTDTLDKLATTDALEVRYGNDWDTNYYHYKYDKADLSAGWNIIKFNSTEATEEGTVTITECDSLVIKLTFTGATDELAADEVIIDDFKLAPLSSYFKDFDSTNINETAFEVTSECYLNSVEANGFLLNGVGTFNTDATALMGDVFTFTGISKTLNEELSLRIKNRIVRR